MVNLKLKQHLFFDFDDTLWDFEKNSAIVLKDLFTEFELETKLKTDFDTFYRHYKTVNQVLWSKYYKKQIDKTYLRNHRFNEAFKLFDYDNYQENLLVTEQYLFRSPKGTLLKENCLEVLDYLHQKYHLHIITNGFKEVQYIKLNGSGIKKYFKNVIISEEHQLTKPDEKIFRLAETLALTKHQHCVMIGDNLESDIQGASNAGWEAIYFSEQSQHDFNYPQIKNLIELKSIF
jgi:putative hydrolase of the HAD superfamily